MSKVTVIGAGNVGATVANVLAHRDIVNEIVLVDIVGDLARGKALDTWQQAPIDSYSTKLIGTSDYKDTKNSDIVVITAGIPRKPGMSRDDLISTNANIVTSVVKSVLEHSKNPIIIVVSNPLDVMTYAAFKAAGIKSSRVFGMAGILDTARYRAFLDAIIERTKSGGGELVKLMGTSAWYAPGAAAAQMVEAIVKNENRIFPVCAQLTGQYGLNDIFVGVPAKLGKNGIERIIELKLNKEEKKLLHESAAAVKEVMDVFDKM